MKRLHQSSARLRIIKFSRENVEILTLHICNETDDYALLLEAARELGNFMTCANMYVFQTFVVMKSECKYFYTADQFRIFVLDQVTFP